MLFIVSVMIDALSIILYILYQWVLFWFAILSFQCLIMNRIEWVDLSTVDDMYMKENYDIGQDSFTYHVTLFVAKFSPVGGYLAIKNETRYILIKEGKWQIKSLRTRLPKPNVTWHAWHYESFFLFLRNIYEQSEVHFFPFKCRSNVNSVTLS